MPSLEKSPDEHSQAVQLLSILNVRMLVENISEQDFHVSIDTMVNKL